MVPIRNTCGSYKQRFQIVKLTETLYKFEFIVSSSVKSNNIEFVLTEHASMHFFIN